MEPSIETKTKTNKVHTMRGVAEILGVSEALIQKWRRAGLIRIVRFGRCVRVPDEEVARILRCGI